MIKFDDSEFCLDFKPPLKRIVIIGSETVEFIEQISDRQIEAGAALKHRCGVPNHGIVNRGSRGFHLEKTEAEILRICAGMVCS